MLTTTITVGIVGSLFSLSGALYPEKDGIKHPVYSVKNWLFFSGANFLLLFAYLSHLESSTFLFIILQSFSVLSGFLMMLNTPDKIDLPIICLVGSALIMYSLSLYEGLNTIFFIIGLTAMGLGYAFETGTLRRNYCLSFGSLLLAIFSFIEQAWIFFFVKSIFSIFSFYYLFQKIQREKEKHPIILKILNKLKKTEGEKAGHISDVA